MKIVEQSHEILHMDSLGRIEIAGRTCYKSEGKIGCSMTRDEWCGPDNIAHRNCVYGVYREECREFECPEHTSALFTKMLIRRGHDAMIEHGSATVKFVTNRGVSHELVRHRVASFGQESTRYVNYGGKEMEFILPVWSEDEGGMPTWERAMRDAEMGYNQLLSLGWRPEQAREVLPNSLKTEIVVTANYREWRHIMKLRAIGTTGKPHPQMQALMLPLLKEFEAKLPAVFGDLRPECPKCHSRGFIRADGCCDFCEGNV